MLRKHYTLVWRVRAGPAVASASGVTMLAIYLGSPVALARS